MEQSYLLSMSEEDLQNIFKPHSDIGVISKFSSGFPYKFYTRTSR